MKVRHLVSDRASALIQLGKAQYLGVCSMPDLFHFNQTLARRAGAFIGKAWKESLQQLEKIKTTDDYYSQRKPFEDAFLFQDLCKRKYRMAMHAIHKAIHPFNEEGGLKETAQIQRPICQSIRDIEMELIRSKAATRSDNIGTQQMELNKMEEGFQVDEILKLHNQISDIVKGVQQWQQWAKERLSKFVDKHFDTFTLSNLTPDQFRNYLLHYLLPWLYWQVILQRTPTNPKNRPLLDYYQQLIKESTHKYIGHPLTSQLNSAQMHLCQQWADQVVNSFQRSSSQVEGRNGHLAFMHKANRGIAEQRLKVLTVVHNFDIHRADGSTPAQRLFQQTFPDLFEHVLQNVTAFKEPRGPKPNQLVVNNVRA